MIETCSCIRASTNVTRMTSKCRPKKNLVYLEKYTFTMNKTQQKLIADIVKDKRMFLGYTQKEVAEITRISLRSIQRIEKGEVMPRMHTLKLLASCLDFSLDSINDANTVYNERSNKYKITLSLSLIILPMLLFAAFIAQSSTFPETDFELLMALFFILSLFSICLLKVWSRKSE